MLKTFQAEPGGVGIHDIDRYFIYHYTFDLKIGGWEWSKRRFGAAAPRTIPSPPERGAGKSVHLFVKMMNEAMAALPNWGGRPTGKRQF